jgi:DNA polymerase III subunit delta'
MLAFNWNLKGHDKVLHLLENDIQQENLAHANLFVGPENIGKYSAAKKLALLLQCEQKGCGSCNVCREIDNKIHTDTLEIVNDGEKIKIDSIRNIIEKAFLTKQSRYKVLLIQDVERMTDEAANAILKTLEDPPGDVLFFLTSSRPNDLLPTILSRVRVYKFGKLSESIMFELLNEKFPLADEEALRLVTEFSAGQPGKACLLLENSNKLQAYKKVYEDIYDLLEKNDKVDQCAYIGNLVSISKEMKNDSLIYEFMDIFQVVLRKKLMMNVEQGNDIISRKRLLALLEKINVIKEALPRNVNTKMLLENLMFTI